jgi:hypothetical protein
MTKGEFVVAVRLSPADWAHLDELAAAGGWADVPSLAASLLRAVIADDVATEGAKPARTKRAAYALTLD